MISISKAEHLPSFRNRGPGELGNGLLPGRVWFPNRVMMSAPHFVPVRSQSTP